MVNSKSNKVIFHGAVAGAAFLVAGKIFGAASQAIKSARNGSKGAGSSFGAGYNGAEYDDFMRRSVTGRATVNQFNPRLNMNLGFFGYKGTGKLSDKIGTSYDINKLKKTQPYTYPGTVSSMKESIMQNGPSAVPPIEIRVHQGKVLVVEGHHRLEAFRQLGYDRVPVKYIHSSQLGKMQKDGITYYRTLQKVLDALINN